MVRKKKKIKIIGGATYIAKWKGRRGVVEVKKGYDGQKKQYLFGRKESGPSGKMFVWTKVYRKNLKFIRRVK